MIRSRFTKPAIVALASVVALAPWSLGASPAFASTAAQADAPPADHVLVTGVGEVSGTPDTLTAEFAVETTAATIALALDGASAAATRMHDALVKAGVAKADLQTSNFTIGSKLNDQQAIIGYTVNEGLTAKIRDLPHAGNLMSAAIAAGGDAARLNSVSFAIEKDAGLLTKARKNAFADARKKAELFARAAGRPLGRVLTVTETTPSFGGGGALYSHAAMDSPFPIEPGRQQLTATVTVDWALDPLPA
jgi:uncharacterized protein YggE